MQLRTKIALAFVFMVVLLIGGFLFHVDFLLRQAFTDQATRTFRSIASASGSAYIAFMRVLKTRTIDWSSDGYIRKTTEQILKSTGKARAALIEELAHYLRTFKMPYDPAVSSVDIFDLRGAIILSSNPSRNNIQEDAAHIIAMQSERFGYAEVSMGIPAHRETERSDIHVMTRIFAVDADPSGALRPLDAVLMLHFSNVDELNVALNGELGYREGILNSAFLNGIRSAEVYLVGPDKSMIASSRSTSGLMHSLTASTSPVAACTERGVPFEGIYVNHLGSEVIGSSVCAKYDGVTIIAEAATKEVFAPYNKFRIQIILAGILTIFLGILGSSILSRQLLHDLALITEAVADAIKHEFKMRADLHVRGELSAFAENIRRMLNEISIREEKLHAANAGLARRIRERTEELERLKANLEAEVENRTKEVRAKLKELEQFRALFVERELKMIELKKEIARLEAQIKKQKT